MHDGRADFQLPDPAAVERATAALRLLSDPTRFRVLWCLLQGESSVACLAELVGAAPTAVSQHLAKLRLSGLVTTRREGTFVHYRVSDEALRHLMADALAFGTEPATA